MIHQALFEWAGRHAIPPHALGELLTLWHSVAGPVDPGLTEAGVQSRLRLCAAAAGNSLWRNNNGACKDDTGRLIRYGIGNDSKKLNDLWKSSDLIGITPVSWQGRTFGVFTAIEVKREGWRAPENDRDRAQMQFGLTVESMGGIFAFATCNEDYLKRVSP